MPKTKGPNPKKMAAQTWGGIKALAAAEDGKYEIAIVEKALGFCQFRARLQTSKGEQEVIVLVRGKNKGGAACPTRVEPGCYVIVDGDPRKIMEVMGVVNRQTALDRLRGAGRVKLAAEAEDDLFEEEGAVVATANLWAKRDDDREALANALVNKYRNRQADGVKMWLAVSERATKAAEAAGGGALEADVEAEEEVDIADYLGLTDGDEGGKKAITSVRRLRAIAERSAEQEAEAAAEAAQKAAVAAEWRAMAAGCADEDGGIWSAAPASAMAPIRPVAQNKSWEEAADELDIDAI